MSFHPADIATMLSDYESDCHTGMDIPAISERVYFYTSGYPFLVSDICKVIDEAPLAWSTDGVDMAAKMIVSKTNLLFDDMIKNVSFYPEFGKLTEGILLRGEQVSAQSSNENVNLGLMYGIYGEKDGKVIISNALFRTWLTNHFISIVEIKGILYGYNDYSPQFIHDGILDLETVFTKFSVFMREEYRDSDSDFIERQGRLLFLSFLRGIINGKGNYAIEPETRGSKRMDIVVFFERKEYIIELKIWRGESYEAKGMKQLAGYVNSRGQKKGYLLSYCNLKKSPRESGHVVVDGVEIYEQVVAYRDRIKDST
jgi:hypothetical protein